MPLAFVVSFVCSAEQAGPDKQLLLQASQSELDLEKFAASILLEDGPLSAPSDLSAPANLAAPQDLGQARCSDSSLQGSNSGWEAMLMDSGSVEPPRAGLDASMDASPASDLTTIGTPVKSQ